MDNFEIGESVRYFMPGSWNPSNRRIYNATVVECLKKKIRIKIKTPTGFIHKSVYPHKIERIL